MKLQQKSVAGSKIAFGEEMEAEYTSVFFGGGTKRSSGMSTETGTSSQFASTTIVAKGGHQDVATILSNMYSPTFESDFKDWLQSIPTYPKAIAFKVGSIVDLLNFRVNDLFIGEDIDWGCESHSGELIEETMEGGSKKWYYKDTSGKKFDCPFRDRQVLDDAIRRRRDSLSLAIDVYLREDEVITDIIILLYIVLTISILIG